MKSVLRIYPLALLLLAALPVAAGVEPMLSARKRGPVQLQVNETVVVTDDKYTCLTTSSCSPAFTPVKQEGLVVLGIASDSNQCQAAYQLTMGLELTWYEIGDPTTPKTRNIALTINYDPAAATPTDERAVYYLANAVKITAKVTSITSTIAGNTIPSNVYIDNMLNRERYYTLGYSSSPAMSAMAFPQGDLITLNWSTVTGAEEYDLEWLYVDDFKDLDGGGGRNNYTASQLGWDFTNNATRVTVKANSYTMRNVYEHGYLLFRVRYAGWGGASFTQRLESPWSKAASGSNLGSSFTDNTDRYTVSTGHESALNWQWSSTYAEEGKYKTVISYADGSLRGRQTVTAINSENFTVVAESFFDHVGRKAADALPAPTGQSIIEYYENFNLSNTSGLPYSWKDFDTSNIASPCKNVIASMKNTAGASKYYSSQNPDKTLFQAYVPDAQLYPFVHTEYSRDNTGRISRQGGVGTRHQLDSGHETQYFYGTPTQVELDRLFGADIGDYRRYKKNMVVDANGQTSVSYINARGKVVATAVAGDRPTSMLPISSADTVRKSFTIDITANTQIDPVNMSITASQDLMLSTQSYVTLDYKLKRTALQLSGCDVSSLCFDCVYDLKIEVKDDCGSSVYAYAQNAVLPFDTTCVNDSFTRNQVILLPRGHYSIYKQLTINEASIDQHADVYMRHNTCVKSVDSIYNELISRIDFSGCNVTCESCRDSLGTLEEYIEEQTAGLDLLDQDSLIRKVTIAYNHLMEDCDALCDDYTPCSVERTQLLQDVSPGGQYFEYSYAAGGEPEVTDVLSFGIDAGSSAHDDYKSAKRNWQNPAIVYCDANGDTSLVWYDGNWVKPNAAPIDVFLLNWRASWADSLIQMHPEYCYYEWCLDNIASQLYDQRMYNAETFAAAQADSLLNPVGVVIVSYPERRDPYFAVGGQGSGQLLDMRSKINSYTTFNGYTYSMYDMAAIMANCPLAREESAMRTCLAAIPFGSGTTGQKDKQWEAFRALYQGAKAALMETRRDIYLGSCDNCYIGFNGTAPSCSGNVAFASKNRIFTNAEDIAGIDPSGPINTVMAQAKDSAAVRMVRECALTCESMADQWMRELAGCNMDETDSAVIRAALIRVCSLGCDAGNPYGANTVSPGNRGYGGCRSFAEVLDSVLGSGYRSPLCNENLLSGVYEYGHDYLASDRVPMDSCFEALLRSSMPACSTLSPDGVTLQHMLERLQINGNFIVPRTTIITVFGSTILAEYNNTIRKHLLSDVAEDPLDFFRSFVDGDTLIGRFITRYNNLDRDSCTFKLRKPAGYVGTFPFNNIAEIQSLETDPDSFSYCYQTGAFQVTVRMNDDNVYTLKGWAGCFNVCNKPATFLSDLAATITSATCVPIDSITVYNAIQHLCYGDFYNPYVPRELTCKPACITCDRLYAAQTRFSSVYSGIFTVGDTAGRVQGFSETYANFMNGALGFNMTYDELRTFRKQCDSFYRSPLPEYGEAYYDYTWYRKAKNGCAPGMPSLVKDTLMNKLSRCDEGRTVLVDTMACGDDVRQYAYEQAQDLYQRQLDSLRLNFRQKYIQKCLSSVSFESFKVTYYIKEYTYTLYYYDQASNLVKTVPPKGVTYITSQSDFDKIAAYRLDPSVGSNYVVPAHTIITGYQYNTLEQVALQRTPETGNSTFWYDYLGRLAVSSNAKQTAVSRYSYTKYDALGRITEVGETHSAVPMSRTTSRNPVSLNSWYAACDHYDQITRTVYEEKAAAAVQTAIGNGGQQNLRNRVSYMTYDADGNSIAEYGTYYTYDIHGNVNVLLQEYDQFRQVNGGYFKVEYRYDLISGNVNQVSYQQGHQDQFFHKYEYDADNRLTKAYTSRDNILWDNDAQYFYYKHGPLARAEIGELKVQGTDYAYTIHGWLKGVNSGSLDSSRDIGKDGWQNAGNTRRYIPKDAFGFTLGYYQGDYQDIAGLGNTARFEIISLASVNGLRGRSPELFNGNITNMVVAVGRFMEGSYVKPRAYAYQYDQLNRLISAVPYDSINMAANQWYANPQALLPYQNTFTYDLNGNISQQRRQGAPGATAMDSLTYNYLSGTNKLNYVADRVGSGAYPDDIDNQTTGNYGYDLIGNIVSDVQEQIDTISWSVYGKIVGVSRSSGSVRPELAFTYGPGGHRLSKSVKDSTGMRTEYYVRDAQGNILATYMITNATFETIDSSYMRVINKLVGSVGSVSFAAFMKAQFSSNDDFMSLLFGKIPNNSLYNVVMAAGGVECTGDKLYGELFNCCNNCSDVNNRKLFNNLVDQATFTLNLNLASPLLACKPEMVLQAALKTWGALFLSGLSSALPPGSGAISTMKSHFISIYPQFTLTSDEDYLINDVPVAELARYMSWDLENNILGFDHSSLMNLYGSLISGMGSVSDVNEMIRLYGDPCKFLECMRGCFNYDADLPNTGCTNNFASSLGTYYDLYIDEWSPEPDYASVRSTIGSLLSSSQYEQIVNCDPTSVLYALLKYNFTLAMSDYQLTYGGSLSTLSAHFTSKYPPIGGTVTSDMTYLQTQVPVGELVDYIYRVNQGLSFPGFMSWLRGTFTTLGSLNVMSALSQYLPDCALKECVIATGIAGTVYPSVPFNDYVSSKAQHLVLSSMDLCQPALYTPFIGRTVGQAIARQTYVCDVNTREEVLARYPLSLFIDQVITSDQADAMDALYSCNMPALLTALIRSCPYDFLNYINTSSGGGATMIGNAFTYFDGIYGSGISYSDPAAYLSEKVPYPELIDYILNTASYNFLADVQTFNATLLKRALKEQLVDCDVRSCLTGDILSGTVAFDMAGAQDYYKQFYWTDLLQRGYSCAGDSLVYFTSLYQRNIIVNLLEDWHYPLSSFMTQVQTYYGTPTRNWLDGDTARQVQYACLDELHMYGSNRLGVHYVQDTVYGSKALFDFTLSSGTIGSQFGIDYMDYYEFDSLYHLQRGRRYYEGTNHLGNVLVVFTDKRLAQCAADTVQRYRADVVQAQHYYAFGATMPGLTFTAPNSKYRFGFNGQEQDNEVTGTGNTYTAEYWEYDSRTGRRWNQDPVKQAWESPYAVNRNNPVWLSDPNGDSPGDGETVSGNKKEARSLRKYEKRLDRLKDQFPEKSNDELHKMMEDKFNGRRWMWIRNKNTAGGNKSGSGYSGAQREYYHAGTIYQSQHPESAPEPLPVTPPVASVLAPASRSPIVTVNGDGNTTSQYYSYPLPGSGTISFDLNAKGAEFTYTILQGNNVSGAASSPPLADVTIQPNSPQTISIDVNIIYGGSLFVLWRPGGAGSGSIGMGGNNAATFTPAPPSPPGPVLIKPAKYQLPYRPGSSDSGILYRGNINRLIDQRKDAIGY